MKVLLDTHAILWWATGEEQLSPKARATIADPKTEVFISIASAWETQVKASIGKLKVSGRTGDLFRDIIIEHGFRLVGIELDDIDRLAKLPKLHRDPFDRLLVAQALERDVTLVTKDTLLADYGASTLW